MKLASCAAAPSVISSEMNSEIGSEGAERGERRRLVAAAAQAARTASEPVETGWWSRMPWDEWALDSRAAARAAGKRRTADELSRAAAASATLLLPASRPRGVNYRRELLCRSLEGRRVDLVTIGAEGGEGKQVPGAFLGLTGAHRPYHSTFLI